MRLPPAVELVREQYNKYPYPKIRLFAFPEKTQLWPLHINTAFSLSYGAAVKPPVNPRILVVGCGTFEPLAVARANPKADITAVDISENSLALLKRRLRWTAERKNIRVEQADLMALPQELGKFDLIIATGVLHHLPDPAAGLKILHSFLSPHGILRAMVYSPFGREAVYRWQKTFRALGINNRAQAISFVRSLPADHPQRIQFFLYADYANEAGFRDGFLPAIDHGCDPLIWEKWLLDANFSTRNFLHPIDGMPEAATRLVPEQKQLSDWRKIALLDALGELETNYHFLAAPSRAPKYFMDENIFLQVHPLLQGNFPKKLWDKYSRQYIDCTGWRNISWPCRMNELRPVLGSENLDLLLRVGLILPASFAEAAS